MKTIIRKVKNKQNPYVMMAKPAIQNKNLSLKATGLLSYLLSLPDDWDIHVSELIKHKRDGKASWYSALNELISIGYIEKNKQRNERGQIVGYSYLVHESPYAGNQEMGERQLLSTEGTNIAARKENDWNAAYEEINRQEVEGTGGTYTYKLNSQKTG